MNKSDINHLQKKLAITDAATQVYVQNEGHITLHDVARSADITVAEVFHYFETKDQILRFFYSSLILRYRVMIDEIADFDTFTLSEKLSNFAYTCFDMMQERQEFVRQTFTPLILHGCKKTDYETKIEAIFHDFIKHDAGKAASSDLLVNDYTLPIIRKKYLLLVKFWLHDDSEDKEVTVELVDKLTGLIQEALYTSVIDRTVDLAKFFYSNNVLARQFPCWKNLSSRFEIH